MQCQTTSSTVIKTTEAKNNKTKGPKEQIFTLEHALREVDVF